MVSESAQQGGWGPILLELALGWILLALAFAITTWLLDGIEISGGFWSYVWVSAIFGFVNAIIGTFLRFITFPLTVLTLGLFSIVVNAILLSITDALSDALTIDEFWWTAIWAALVLSIVSFVLRLIARLVLPNEPAAARS
ncbi:MAG TPA: phage holin family protein [Gaiellaceae bacterium]|jgi:putative membrane protein|nr:phage holin family protein [Gaiellaceae bacterium]